jgi:Na+-driven multidrug efflux pump
MGISVTSWFFFYVLIEHHGQTSLAISNTMRNIFGFFGVFNWAFSSAANSMVSNVIGQGKKEEIVRLIAKIMTLSMSVSVVVCILLNFLPHVYFSFFGQGENFIEDGIPTLRVVAFSLIIMSSATVWLNAITGTGKSKITFFIELISIAIYSVYVYVVLEVLKLSITWGWAAELIYWTLLGGLSYLYIRSGKWKAKVI